MAVFSVTETLNVGTECIFESDSKDGRRGVVFEDDGDTGYFYARDYSVPEHLFVDALHVYTTKHVSDKHMPSKLVIIWSDDWKHAALLINQVPHAVFDFDEKIGYSQDCFPEPDPNTGWSHAEMNPSIRQMFYPN